MSLKKFINDKEVRKKFRETFKKPKLEFSRDISIEALTKNSTGVGIAFDYLMRLYIKRLNPHALMEDVLIAERIIPMLNERQRIEAVITINMAKETMEKYLQISGLNDELIIMLLRLAHYDIAYRTRNIGYIPDDIGKANVDDLFIVKKLYSLLEESMWLSSKLCLLNPHFGLASLLVGGADADLVIDDMLIDIKTSKAPGISRENFNQLIGYYILYRLSGMDDGGRSPINKLGIYSARYGQLISFEVKDIMDEDVFMQFSNWFINKAGELYRHDDEFLKHFRR